MSDKKRRNSFFFVADITVKSEDETPTDDCSVNSEHAVVSGKEIHRWH